MRSVGSWLGLPLAAALSDDDCLFGSEDTYLVMVERSPPAFQINFPRLWPSTV